MTFNEYLALVNGGHPAEQRYGQWAYNLLREHRPDIGKKIAGTNLDPFYAERTDDPRMSRFFMFVGENW